MRSTSRGAVSQSVRITCDGDYFIEKVWRIVVACRGVDDTML